MLEKMFRGRLEAGFNPLDYHFAGFNDYTVSFEFRKPGTPLRFGVKYGEGGVRLLWTEEQSHNLLDRSMPPEVYTKTFSGSPEDFWRAVADIIEGKEP